MTVLLLMHFAWDDVQTTCGRQSKGPLTAAALGQLSMQPWRQLPWLVCCHLDHMAW